MDLNKIKNKKVRAAIEALQKSEEKIWFGLFTDDAILYEDGNHVQFNNFFKKTLGHERFIHIDSVSDDGLEVIGDFHSDQWGNFKAYYRFTINKTGKIEQLEIGHQES